MTPRDRRAILFGAAGLGLIALVWLGVLPWWGHWGQTRARLADATAQVADLEDQTQRLAALVRRVEDTYGPAAGKPLESVEATRAKFLKVVVDLMNSGGVQMRSVQPEAVRPLREVPGAVLLPFQVQGMCQFPQLVQLLAALRGSEALVLVERVEATQNPPGSGQLNLTIVLATLAREETSR